MINVNYMIFHINILPSKPANFTYAAPGSKQNSKKRTPIII